MSDIVINGPDRPLCADMPGKWTDERAQREIARLLRDVRAAVTAARTHPHHTNQAEEQR